MFIQCNIVFQVEIITDLQEIMRKHLLYFRHKTNCIPQHIIMFRDGVSESQFQQVFYQNNIIVADLYFEFLLFYNFRYCNLN